ncbi:MAG: NUDIX domain-containing protein [Rikenellaceae bacterium]
MEKCLFLNSFHFCPKCGGNFVDNNDKSKRCEKCGFVYYFNPSAAVAAIIRNEQGDILVSTRDREPAKGSYDLPGGFVDCFETAEQSVSREILEECHLETAEVKYLFSLPNIYTYSNFDVHTLDIFFECTIKDYKPLKADDDVATLEFIALKDLDPSKFGLQSIREGLEIYLKGL